MKKGLIKTLRDNAVGILAGASLFVGGCGGLGQALYEDSPLYYLGISPKRAAGIAMQGTAILKEKAPMKNREGAYHLGQALIDSDDADRYYGSQHNQRTHNPRKYNKNHLISTKDLAVKLAKFKSYKRLQREGKIVKNPPKPASFYAKIIDGNYRCPSGYNYFSANEVDFCEVEMLFNVFRWNNYYSD
jgi:hypothetical protein